MYFVGFVLLGSIFTKIMCISDIAEMPQISVQLMNKKIITVGAIPTRHTVEHVKTEIQKKQDIPFDQQSLIFQGVLLKDGCKLSSYNIEEKSVLYLVLREKGSK